MRLFFVTDQTDSHVDRFHTSFQTIPDVSYTHIGVEHTPHGPTAVIDGEPQEGWEALQRAMSGEGNLVVSGPLDRVSAHLVGGFYRHIGISWATDVMVTAAHSPVEVARLSDTVNRLDVVVTDNYATENALIALGVAPDAVCRIPWGPEDSPVTHQMDRADLGVTPDAFLVMYPRSLESHYQPEVFIEALSLVVGTHPQLVAVFVESGSLVDSVKQDLSRRGLENHVVWAKPVPAEQFSALLRCADVVVVTPLTDGTSVTVMAAMHEGVPVISSLTNGSAEWVVEGVTGWAFPVGDASALAKALARVITATPETLQAVTSHAQRLVGTKAGWARSEGILLQEIRRFLGT